MPRITHVLRGLALAALATSAGAVPAVDPIFADGFEAPPILRYPFDGDGTSIGTLAGYTMTPVSAAYSAGKFDQAISFPSAASYASVDGMRTVLGSLAKVTVGFWYYQSAFLSPSIWSLSNRSTAPYGGIALYESASQVGLCVSTASSAFIGGSCANFPAPATGAWHHWIIRYAGTGSGPGQGGPVNIYIDDVLVHTTANDASNDPVFSSAIPDTLSIGGNGALMDDLRIYDNVFSPAQQCEYIIGGVWTGGSTCALP